ncbi:hypothetical protein AXX12_11360 [Anaerosporomusa subterranea]|uniref:Orc1-like AAA ATPase domain-containing protein n=1 Tax=Anaerosporomusa subterranea TaxID=1794912 RepID=A0A154BPG1_ANASB|nr:hypothetical protein [Anaerosporomusa subterranea]KYZ75791.1 hypothetical protein AXX12_11360 [Anaerosporomusa subterranea]
MIESIDQKHDKLVKSRGMLLEYSAQSLTESDTRSKIIDYIFRDILGWDENCIKREESIKSEENTKYIDYCFESNKNSFIIEAKKAGIYFNLPNQVKRCKRTGIISKDNNTLKALNQAYEYCVFNNKKIGCISNGLQFAVFLINSHKRKYDTYLFNGIDDIINNFTNFFNIFCPYLDGVDSLCKLLDDADKPIRQLPQFSKSMNDITYNADARMNRNQLDISIKQIINHFFTDLVSDDKLDLLEECYCINERIPQYDKQLTDLIIDEIPRLDLPIQDSDFFDEDFRRQKKAFIEDYKKSDLMIIVGGVGSGKTTFIHRYFKSILPQTLRAQVIWLYIDFTQQSSESIDVKNYILKEILQQLRERYSFLNIDGWETLQEIYRSEIVRMQNGVLKPLFEQNKTDFDIKVSEHLLNKTLNEAQFCEDVLKFLSMNQRYKKMICLTIDNADQLSEEFQKKCVTAAYDFSKRINSLILLSMREDSYWRLRNTKPFDAYNCYAYHISAPSVSAILAKRIEAAIRRVGKQMLYLNSENGIRCEIKTENFLNIIKESLYQKNDTINIELFEALSAGNLRLAADLLGTFLTSGHTNTREYIEIYLTQGNYKIPFHAFVRSIALGDYMYYHSDKSLMLNMFTIDDDGFYSHFTKVRILYYLSEKKSLDSPAGKGYFNVDRLYDVFNDVCKSQFSFREIITPLLRRRLIQADNGVNNSGHDAQYVKLTSSGYYYITVLMKNFAYLERLCEDTHIHSMEYFRKMHEITDKLVTYEYPKQSLEWRLKRVLIFLEYLKEEESKDLPFLENTPSSMITDEIIRCFTQQSDAMLKKSKRIPK